MINIGQYIETAINWLTNHFATFFDTLSIGIGGFVIHLSRTAAGRTIRHLDCQQQSV